MKQVSKFSQLLAVGVGVSCILLFQNCGPAQLSVGGFSSADLASTVTMNLDPQVGSKVDLPSIVKAPQEQNDNILFPAPAGANTVSYSQGTPITENIVLRNNNFNKVFWVHGPTQTVVATGTEFNRPAFAATHLGEYYVFGLRGESVYTLSRFLMANKSTSSLPVNSAQAVVINQKVVFSDFQNEYLLVTVDAPDVELQSIQFSIRNVGTIISGRRALMVSKRINEVFDLEVLLMDMGNQSLTKLLSFPAKSLPSPTPTPTPTPMVTPTPAPPPVTATCPTERPVVSELGKVSGSTTPLKVTLTTSVPVGALLVAQVSYRSFFERSVSDSKGNTWKVAVKGISSTQISTIFYTKTTVALAAGDEIILSDGLTNAGLGMSVIMATGVSTLDQIGSDVSTTAPGVTTAGNLKCPYELIVGVTSFETATADFTTSGGFMINHVWKTGISGGTSGGHGYLSAGPVTGSASYAPISSAGSGAYVTVIATFH